MKNFKEFLNESGAAGKRIGPDQIKSDLVFMAEAREDKTFNEATLDQYKVTVGGKSYTILSTDKVRAAVSVIRSLTRSNQVESMLKTEKDLDTYNVSVEVIPTKAHKINDLLGN